MNDHFSIQILSEPSFTVFPQDSGSVENLKFSTRPFADDTALILSTRKWRANIYTHVSIDFWQLHHVNHCLVVVDSAYLPRNNVQILNRP